MSFFIFFQSFTKTQIIFIGGFLILIIGIGDFWAGPQISTSLFYVLPIGICTWYDSRRTGIAFSFLSAFVWFVTDKYSGHIYSHFFIIYWNSAVRLGTFLIIAYLLSGYRAQLAAEEQLADTDSLTGASNRRAFYEKIETEISRSRRFHRPFSLAYIDLDNFKLINDTKGHITGDFLLKKVIEVMKANTRVIDHVARLGGDEFAVLFAETGQQAAHDAVTKLQSVLLASMQAEKWPVTFSIGVVTCEEIPESVKDVINFADTLMYSVKKSGKNSIAHASFHKGDDFHAL